MPGRETLAPKKLTVNLDLVSRKVLLIGCGKVGSRKLDYLLETGADITVVEPRPSEELRLLAEKGDVKLSYRFEESLLEGEPLVFLATDGGDVGYLKGEEEEEGEGEGEDEGEGEGEEEEEDEDGGEDGDGDGDHKREKKNNKQKNNKQNNKKKKSNKKYPDLPDLILRKGLWLNVASHPSLGNFTLPAVMDDGSFRVTVSTDGGSPALAARAARALR
jgi:hypothetical protein